MQVLGSVARALDFPLTTPWNKLPESAREAVLYGTKGEAIALRFEDGRKSYEVVKPFEGVIRNLERRMLSTDSAWMREELGKFQASAPCEACDGARLKPEALAVKVAGETIADAVRRPVDQEEHTSELQSLMRIS